MVMAGNVRLERQRAHELSPPRLSSHVIDAFRRAVQPLGNAMISGRFAGPPDALPQGDAMDVDTRLINVLIF